MCAEQPSSQITTGETTASPAQNGWIPQPDPDIQARIKNSSQGLF